MTHRREPMTIHAAIEAAAMEAGGWARAADIAGIGEKRFRDAANPFLEGRHQVSLKYESVRALARAGITSLIDDQARLSGARMVAVPAQGEIGTLTAALAALAKEFGEAVAVTGQALADNEVTLSERRDIEREVLDVISAATAILKSLGPVTGG